MQRSIQSPVSVIIPTLNEADNIPLLFERLHATLHKARIPYEIIVVDDHSSDATVALTRAAAAKYNARVVLKRGKPGKAFSLLEGFDAAAYDLICMIDADLQYPPEAITQMYHKMQYCNADVVITNRIDNKTGVLRKLATGAFHLVFTRALFGINYDTQSGLKLFKKRVLENMTIKPSAWTFDLEFIVRALENNNIIVSEDIAFAERHAGVAKLNLFTAAFEGAWQSLKLRRKTSVKHVKLHYQYLKPLQQSFNWLLVAIVARVIAYGGGGATADAASNTPIKDALTKTSQLLDPITEPLLEPTQPTTTPVNPGNHGNPVTPQIITAPTTTNSTPAAQPVVASAATNQPTTVTTAVATTSTANRTTPTVSVASTKPTAATVNTDTLTTEDGKQAPYYTASALSASRTNNLLKLSLFSVAIGGASIIVGLILLGIRNYSRRNHRQHSPVHAQRI